MTREEAINHLKTVAKSAVDSGYDSAVVDAVSMAIKALEQEPCGKDINVPATDAISRQAVLDGLASIAKAKARSDAQKSLMGRVMFFTEQLPPVTPKPKTGHWIPSHVPESILDECSECGFSCGAFTFNYCPNCGAKMVEPQAESKEKTCKNCINAKECVMYDPNMKRCKEYKTDPKEIYNKGFADGQKALAEHLKLCKEELLDKIRAEIEKQENWLFVAGLTTYNVDIAFSSIKSVLTESEEV